MAVDHTGTYGAMVTDQGSYRFGIKAPDPSKTLTKIAGPSRDVEFGPDGTLYVLEGTQVSAYGADGAQKWAQPLTDGRRIVVGQRVVVLDGTQRLVALSPQDGTQDVLAPVGQIQDLVVSRDGHWIGVIADARRAVLFRLQ
jgi:outer membrane protein assembly factor BamB